METKEPPEPPPRNPMRIMTSVSTTEVNSYMISVMTNLIKIQFPPSQKIKSQKITAITPDTPPAMMANGLVENKELSKSIEESDIKEVTPKEKNEEVTTEVFRLKKKLDKSPEHRVVAACDGSDVVEVHSNDNEDGKVERLENELRIAKELILSLKTERKKLRSDKNDLLQQVKHLCASLQDKEQELRNFIRNFEQRIRDSENNAAKACSDNEHDRWTLIKHAHDEAERSLALAAQLNLKDLQLQRMQEQLMEARRQLSGCISDQESNHSIAPIISPSGLGLLNHGCDESEGIPGTVYVGLAGDRGSCSADSGVRGSDRESAAGDLNLSDGPCEGDGCLNVDSDSISLISSHHNMNHLSIKLKLESVTNTIYVIAFSYNRSAQQLDLPMELEGASTSMARRVKNKPFNSLVGGRSSRGGAWGSISRVFARSKKPSKSAVQQCDANEFQWNPLTEESYAEKLKLLREASTMPIELWRSPQIAAWLEVGLGMPKDCIRFCAENVKSGKVLLELTDAELESGLGATHPMHRKKLRLAIEEQRRPDLARYQTIGQLGHSWTALEWLHEIGLSQYSESFLHSLVDARMLDTLSKKELEKYLGVTRKFHQASIVHGIHLLRLMKYDRQALAMRRLQSETENIDPIVWTNQRFMRWVRAIDLGEFADNLRNSGVHGGLVVLESSFSGDTMASALGIAPSKNIVRRHLITEFDSLILPSRKNLTQGIRSMGGMISTYDRQNTLSKGYYANSNKPFKTGNNQSPTHSYSSSEGNYAMMDNRINVNPTNEINHANQNNNRRSAPIPDYAEERTSTLPRPRQNRRSAPEFLTDRDAVG
ncbi:unnamed protein product [Diamesa tonsa]